MSDIEFKIDQIGLGLLEFQRPESRNALTWEGMDRFAGTIKKVALLAEIDESPGLRALIVHGQGGSFCAGGDLDDVHHHATKADAEWMVSTMGLALDRLEQLPVPTIAAIEGPAFGGGAEIALACDFRVMGTSSKLGWVQTRLGITTGWGGSQRLLRLIGYARAMDWLMGSRIIPAEDAYRTGLAQRLTTDGSALETAQELAREFLQYDAFVLRSIKEILQAGMYGSPSGAAMKEQEIFPDLWISAAHQDAVRSIAAQRKQDPHT